METNINYTLVGMFVISICAAIVLTIIWLSAGFSIQHYTKYMVYMRESVSGLTINSPVEYNGVEVGSVYSVSLNKRDPQIVEVLLDIDTNTPITTATIATLKSRGITGITFISLKDENDTRIPLVARRGQPYPVIRSGPSLFTRLDTALSQLTTNLHDVAVAIQTLLDTQNQRSIKNILRNMDLITMELAGNSGKMTTILNNTADASAKLNGLITNGSSAMKTLQAQTLPMTYNVLSNLDTMTRDLARVSSELKQNPAVILRGTTPAPLGPGEKR